MDFLVSVEEAKIHLGSQIAARKEITEQLNPVKQKLSTIYGKVEHFTV